MRDIPFESATGRGVIREMKREDIPDLGEIAKDQAIQKNYFVEPPEDLPEYWQRCFQNQRKIRMFEAMLPRTSYQLPIEYNHTVAGLIELSTPLKTIYSSRRISYEDVVEINRFVKKELRNQGIATAATRAIIPVIFEELDAKAIEAVCLKENFIPQLILEKLGFQKINEQRVERNERMLEIVTYAFSRKEYLASDLRINVQTTR